MWCLPSISKLNQEAVNRHKKRRGRVPSPRGKTCSCGSKAVRMIAYHDLFGDREIPKGFTPRCQKCIDDGHDEDGLFCCGVCGKNFVTHYTHEVYYRDSNDGGEGGDEPQRLCLDCALDEALISDGEESPWLYQEDLIRLEDALTDGQHEAAMEWIGEKAKHLIGVGTEYWKEWLVFYRNVECDSSSGGRLINTGSCESSPEGTVREVVEHIRAALAIAPRCALIIDATYQFSVSLGIFYELEFAQAELEQADVREVRA